MLYSNSDVGPVFGRVEGPVFVIVVVAEDVVEGVGVVGVVKGVAGGAGVVSFLSFVVVVEVVLVVLLGLAVLVVFVFMLPESRPYAQRAPQKTLNNSASTAKTPRNPISIAVGLLTVSVART